MLLHNTLNYSIEDWAFVSIENIAKVKVLLVVQSVIPGGGGISPPFSPKLSTTYISDMDETKSLVLILSGTNLT